VHVPAKWDPDRRQGHAPTRESTATKSNGTGQVRKKNAGKQGESNDQSIVDAPAFPSLEHGDARDGRHRQARESRRHHPLGQRACDIASLRHHDGACRRAGEGRNRRIARHPDLPWRPARFVAGRHRGHLEWRDPAGGRRRGPVRAVRAAIFHSRSALHLARSAACADRTLLTAGGGGQQAAGRKARHAGDRLDLLWSPAPHFGLQTCQDRRGHEGVQAPHPGGRYLPCHDGGLGSPPNTAQLQRTLPCP
jgi:hypothetical protein